MSSAKRRVEQVSGHVQNPDRSPKIICQTKEHSKGNTVATITFHNPAKLNTASNQLQNELIEVCERLSKDETLRVVVLTGAPPLAAGKAPAFIGGADIQELSRLSSSDDARKYITQIHKTCLAIQNIPVPVIARVHGYALGAGLEIMAACDLRVATRASKFGMPEPKIGLPSVAEAALFPSMIGIGRTKRLVYLGEDIPADEALSWGLIERVVGNEAELDTAVKEWVDRLVTMGPQILRVQKRLVTKWENSTLAEGIEAGVETLAEVYEDGGSIAKKMMAPLLKK
ncbi:Short-chain-enoyl-CoA hydratase [Cercospora beticola]|uniref:Short-chain-enoyl-CoA hydratase n=1 Tax=Cercospora beticola TaxID=122368 RepID=A0A2G5HIK6_CERBT|nr:Short-chain-enoyl-CoA hydratase [Cercospora beticola]PIA92397.1 Short-chain-enoyl-CoA hydratase [Cercospora beticola]WPB06546.1 hypothetical protein RHO25_011203 [Cercospora beticola]